MNDFKTILEKIEALYSTQKSVLTLTELSRYTGLSKSCLYKLTSARKIPFSCPNGKTLFFDKAAIDGWLLGNPVPTTDDIAKAAINYVILNPGSKGGASL